jgi:hypothetical protein
MYIDTLSFRVFFMFKERTLHALVHRISPSSISLLPWRPLSKKSVRLLRVYHYSSTLHVLLVKLEAMDRGEARDRLAMTTDITLLRTYVVSDSNFCVQKTFLAGQSSHMHGSMCDRSTSCRFMFGTTTVTDWRQSPSSVRKWRSTFLCRTTCMHEFQSINMSSKAQAVATMGTRQY